MSVPCPAPRSAPPAPGATVVLGATRAAAEAAAAHLARHGAPAGAAPVDASDVALRCAGAERIYVLDPGRVRAWRLRYRAARRGATGESAALGAPLSVAHRLALLSRLRHHRGVVRWVTTRVP